MNESPEPYAVYLKAIELATKCVICKENEKPCNKTECGSPKCVDWYVKRAKKEIGIK